VDRVITKEGKTQESSLDRKEDNSQSSNGLIIRGCDEGGLGIIVGKRRRSDRNERGKVQKERDIRRDRPWESRKGV